MYKAIKDNKIIAISDTDSEFFCLEKDEVIEDTEHTADDYGQYNGEFLLKSEIPFDKEGRIAQLKGQLDATDYVVIKIAESDNAEEQAQLREHYAEVIVNRKAWRAEINELEGQK